MACGKRSNTAASSSRNRDSRRQAATSETCSNNRLELLARIESHVRRHDLIAPGGEVLCLVSGGADSTCLFHALRELGYAVSALHVDHGLRGDESDADATWCVDRFGAEVVQGAARCATEAELRDVRYSFRAETLRATGHTLSDQVETILYRLAARGTTNGIEVHRSDGVVRPLLCVWREETEAFCRARGLEWRTDSSNPDTLRGLIRNEILPLLERIHPGARENVLRVLDERRTMPPALVELLGSAAGSKRIDLGGGLQVVREYDRVWLEPGPRELDPAVEWGAWRIESRLPGLKVRGWRPGDRLVGRSKKVQDVFVDAKIPRSDREGWPLVVRGDEVVAVPGIVEAEGVTATRVAN
ncbi:MAG TPA: tRNA lysidine(34) synthetase TilS [Gaiellaceae bacterium]|nr:tRNA lysidine(34) synthetase TilS [Gaiellaceae bacterium]